jgi:adenylate cyclase
MPKLFLKEGAGQGLSYELEPGTTTIGRSRGSTIELGGLGVSRSHAAIRFEEGGKAILEDLGSKNGTTVNGTRVEKAVLNDGDEIGIGQTVLLYRDDRTSGGEAPVESTVRSVLKVDADGKIEPGNVTGDVELLKKTHRYLSILYDVGRAIASTLNLNELLTSIMSIVFEVIHPDEAFIMLKDDAQGQLKLRLFRSKLSGGAEGTIAVSRTILNKVVQEGVAVLSADASSDSRFKSAQSVMRFHMMSTMCVPLVSKGGVIGVIHTANRISSGEFQEEDLQLLSGIANQAALAIENAKLYHNIQLEVRRRNNLQRYLSPNLVEQVIDGKRELNLGGQIKEVTILFSDIRDFTKLSEELPPNEVVGMLNEYFNEMTRIAFKKEGTIDKFIGDAIIVVFGAAFPHPDDPLRAVETAIEMQSAMKQLNEGWQAAGRKTFHIGIGVNTGEALYGNVGSEQRMELTVIGDAVNLAARLAEIAGGGEVLMSGFTWEALEGRIAAERIPPVKIKGKAEAVEVYKVRA